MIIREIGAKNSLFAGDSSLRSLDWGRGGWITFIQEILKCGEFLHASQPLSIVLLPSPPSLGILFLGECWGFLKLDPFVLAGLIFIGTISENPNGVPGWIRVLRDFPSCICQCQQQ